MRLRLNSNVSLPSPQRVPVTQNKRSVRVRVCVCLNCKYPCAPVCLEGREHPSSIHLGSGLCRARPACAEDRQGDLGDVAVAACVWDPPGSPLTPGRNTETPSPARPCQGRAGPAIVRPRWAPGASVDAITATCPGGRRIRGSGGGCAALESCCTNGGAIVLSSRRSCKQPSGLQSAPRTAAQRDLGPQQRPASGGLRRQASLHP